MFRASMGLLAVLLASCQVHGPSPTGPAPDGAPPATRTVPVVDDFHGTHVPDPYHWLEALDSAEVRDWAGRQDAYARARLDTPARRQLLSRIRALASPPASPPEEEAAAETSPAPAAPPPAGVRLEPAPIGTHQLLVVGDGAGQRTLADPHALGNGHDITRFVPSPDGTLVAYAVSRDGGEWMDVRVVRVADGTALPEVVDGLLWQEPMWSADSRGFFYVHQHRGPAGGATLRAPSLRYHRVGTPQAQDRVLLQTPEDNTEVVLEAGLLGDGRLLWVSAGSSAHWEGLGWISSTLRVMDLGAGPAPALDAPLRTIGTPGFGYRPLFLDGDVLTLLTDLDAPRKRLVAVDLRHPDPSRWREIIPQSAAILQRVTQVGEYLVALYLQDVQHQVTVFRRDGTLVRALPQPPLTFVVDIAPGAQPFEVAVTAATPLTPPATTTWDLRTGASTASTAPVSGFDASAHEARQVWYASKDGTRVPMFLLHRRGITRNGRNPTVLFGYGASGTVPLPYYWESALAWLERGGVLAMASVRGGGEFGRAWHEAAAGARKQTSFDDFIAAAEFLIAEGYTGSRHLAAWGNSHGGLLVTASMTQRPELFAAVIAEVPVTDLLGADRGRHTPQFGSPQDPGAFRTLHAYSPLQRIQAGTCYPATLVTTALNDERAAPSMAMKFAARLQAAQSCPRPVLLRADTTGGHLGSRGPQAWMEDNADALGFAAEHTGLASATVQDDRRP